MPAARDVVQSFTQPGHLYTESGNIEQITVSPARRAPLGGRGGGLAHCFFPFAARNRLHRLDSGVFSGDQHLTDRQPRRSCSPRVWPHLQRSRAFFMSSPSLRHQRGVARPVRPLVRGRACATRPLALFVPMRVGMATGTMQFACVLSRDRLAAQNVFAHGDSL